VSILNRRNAVLGWAGWKVVKRVVRRKAAPPPPPTPLERVGGLKAVAAALVAAGAGVAGLLRLRKRGGG